MEIADIFVINKADRPGADRLQHEVELMLGLRLGHTFRHIPAHHGVELRSMNPARMARQAAATEEDRWTPPVLPTVAVKGEGIAELIGAIDRHFAYLERSGELRARRRQRLRERVIDVVEDRVRTRLWRDETTNAWIDAQLPELESGALTPFAAADALLARSGDLLTRGRT
jgi:LAO/AO transport system kinase